MAVSYKTPGVYIEEKNAFPNSVVAVATAVPAFIGYTAKAEQLGKKVFNKPVRVTSLVEFEQVFGQGPKFKFSIPIAGDTDREKFPINGVDLKINVAAKNFIMYNAIRLFYQNGGGACYIVSVGNYDAELTKKALVDGIETLVDESEPTMVLVPDALNLKTVDDKDPKNVVTTYGDCHSVYTACLGHCEKMQSRVTLFDIPGANEDAQFISRKKVTDFKDGIGTNYLMYGAAYFPWLETNVVSDREITFANFAEDDLWAALFPTEIRKDDGTLDPAKKVAAADEEDELKKQIKLILEMMDGSGELTELPVLDEQGNPVNGDDGKPLTEKVKDADLYTKEANLRGMSSTYKNLLVKEAVKTVNLLPASAAMAGVYTAVDNSRGVWKAPANVSLNSVLKPNVNINNDLNDFLNIPIEGKAVNAIRSFPGQGVIVWGARTLDGNSQDWRYVNVRRTMIFIEQSIKAAARAYVFEPNDANTWVLVQGMISNFLNNVWKAGGLFGSTPGDAYDVQVGLGTTMTANDILDGYMRITVRVAVVRPAEFIVITFQQKMAEA